MRRSIPFLLLPLLVCTCCTLAQNLITETDVMVSMRDGKRLATDIVRPPGDAKVPVVLVRTPYRKGTGGGMIARFGVAYACQDVRGRYKSEGDFYPFLNEINDAQDTIEWLAKQPWCNGEVAMSGGSYVGFTQLAAALSKTPQLKCIMPAVPPADFDNRAAFFGGALRMELVQGWMIGQAHSSQRVLNRQVGADELALWSKTRDFMSWCRHLPLGDAGPISLGGESYTKGWRDMVASWDKPGAWARCSSIKNAADIQVPVLIKAGFFDIFGQENIELLLALRKQGGTDAAKNHSHLVIGPWCHNLGGAAGDINFANARAALATLDQQWLLHWLRGQKNEVDQWPPIRAYVMNQDRWIDTDVWPPAQAVATRYYFDGKTLSTALPSNAQEPSTFTYDPENPVPTLGGCNLTIVRGVQDHRKNAQRPDVLSFMTPPLEKGLTVVGPMKAHLFVSSSAPDTDFTAMLVDVRPDGYMANIQDGIVRLRYRNGREKAELLHPGEVVEADVNLWSTAWSFKAGHRVAVLISSSNFPRFDRHLNVAESPVTWSKGQSAKNTLFHDAKQASYIELPVMP